LAVEQEEVRAAQVILVAVEALVVVQLLLIYH
jgi:predicted nucleic acid-binding Zn ribbon protein